jgi:hypothetical protein
MHSGRSITKVSISTGNKLSQHSSLEMSTTALLQVQSRMEHHTRKRHDGVALAKALVVSRPLTAASLQTCAVLCAWITISPLISNKWLMEKKQALSIIKFHTPTSNSDDQPEDEMPITALSCGDIFDANVMYYGR